MNLSWLPGVFDLLGPVKEIVVLLLGGVFASAAGVGLAFLLDLPVIRRAVYGFFFAVGKANSLLFVRWFGRFGQRIEDKLQRFLQDIVLDGYFAGLDQDDQSKG